jgi:hypothetical protein
MAQQTGKGLIVERIMRDRDSIWREVVEERGLGRLTLRMLTTSVLSLAAYGAVLGASHSLAQAGMSAAKLPLLFLATLAICLPTLYLFNLIFGARLSMMQAVTLIMTCITVISVLALAFAPISLFFLITADNYSFFKLLNVGILVLAALVGLRFLTSGMTRLNQYQELVALQAAKAVDEEEAARLAAAHALAAPVEAPATIPATIPAQVEPGNGTGAIAVLPKPPAVGFQPVATFGTPSPTSPQYRPTSMTLLYIWIALFGFVGTQLAWTLRPFFGSPDEPFQIFRNIEGTFYQDIFRTIGHLFGS